MGIKDFEHLQQDNFCFKRLRYNLPTEFEVEEAYTKPLPVNGIIGSSCSKSIYNEYMKEKSYDKLGSLRKRTVQCTLCGAEICRERFSRHMQRFHLENETCTSCGLDFRPDLFPSHVVKCVSEGKSNIKHVSGSSRKGDVTMTGSSSGERRDCEEEMDEATTSDPLRRKGDAENYEVLHGEKQMGSENEYCSVETVDKVTLKLVTVESPPRSMKLKANPEKIFEKIRSKFEKKMKLTDTGGFRYSQGGRKLSGEEMVKNLSREPIQVELIS